MNRLPMRKIMEILRLAVPKTDVWWPAQSRFEILVGAVLTQNTTWTSVEKAITNLKNFNLLNPKSLIDGPDTAIQQAIKPSGYWRAKTQYLKAIAAWFSENDCQSSKMSDQNLRKSLLAVRGVGEETADDIALYAYNRGLFIYDAYARRLLKAAEWGNYHTYAQARKACDETIRAENFSVSEFGLLHGLIVQAGKDARISGGWEIYWPMITASARKMM